MNAAAMTCLDMTLLNPARCAVPVVKSVFQKWVTAARRRSPRARSVSAQSARPRSVPMPSTAERSPDRPPRLRQQLLAGSRRERSIRRRRRADGRAGRRGARCHPRPAVPVACRPVPRSAGRRRFRRGRGAPRRRRSHPDASAAIAMTIIAADRGDGQQPGSGRRRDGRSNRAVTRARKAASASTFIRSRTARSIAVSMSQVQSCAYPLAASLRFNTRRASDTRHFSVPTGMSSIEPICSYE